MALAIALDERGEATQALAVIHAADVLAPADFSAPAFQATLHSRRHKCGEADLALAEAQTRAHAAAAPDDDAWLVSAELWVDSCHATTTTVKTY